MDFDHRKKLLFFDIDGTLLDGLPGKVPESAALALKQAQENGHYLFINTGRTLCGLPPAITDLGFDGYICGCGSQILFHGEELLHSSIPPQEHGRLKELLDRTGLQAVLEGSGSIYFEDRPDMFPSIEGIRNFYIIDPDPGVICDFDEPGIQYDKYVVVWDENSDFDTWRKETEERGYHVILQADAKPYGFAEVVQKDLSKASGIDFMVDYLGASLDDCYVFGDSNNDLAMLTHVKNSIAMGNSSREVLAVSSYVTTPILRDGIKNALKHFRLI